MHAINPFHILQGTRGHWSPADDDQGIAGHAAPSRRYRLRTVPRRCVDELGAVKGRRRSSRPDWRLLATCTPVHDCINAHQLRLLRPRLG